MRLDKFTIKAQEALQSAQNLAVEAQHSELTPLHVLAVSSFGPLFPPKLNRPRTPN